MFGSHDRYFRPVAIGLLAGLLLVPLGQARAQSQDPEQILAALDSEDYRERQDQTHALLTDETLDLDDVDDLLARSRTPEQRHRLLSVAQHHVLRRRREHVFDQPDRGSLGVSHRTITADDLPDAARHGGPSVEVVLTLPGFPAHGRLEAGDRIVGLAGEALPADFTADHFREMIMRYRSGDELEMTIERHGEQLTRTIELASAQALGAMYNQGELQLRPQFANDWANARRTLQVDDEADAMPLQLQRPPIDVQ